MLAYTFKYVTWHDKTTAHQLSLHLHLLSTIWCKMSLCPQVLQQIGDPQDALVLAGST